jgi:chromosomal replication initiator protein
MSLKEVALERELRYRLDRETYDSWFRLLEFRRVENNCAYFSVSSRFIANWIKHHYKPTLLACCKNVYEVEDVQIEVESISARRQRVLMRLRARSE